MTDRISHRAIEATGYVGDGAQYLADDGTWKAGGGGVSSVVPGAGIAVDNADPANPVVSATGGGGAPAFVGCKARTNGAISAAHATLFYVPFAGADSYDTNSMHDPAVNNTRITIPAGYGGVWRITGSGDWNSTTTTNSSRLIYLRKNGSAFPDLDGRMRANQPSGYTSLTVSAEILLAAGDYIEMQAQQDSGAVQNFSATLAAHYLGTP